VTAASDSRVATDEIALLFREHRRDLERAVAAAVRAPSDVVEDACQNAWTIMLRSQPRRATWFAWLRVVAIHQAWEQCARVRNERPGGPFTSPYVNEIGAYEYPEPPADAPDVPDQVADRIQHAQRLTDLAAIKPQDRRTLYLKGLGYRYREIMELTGASYTAVNRRITEGRRALRKLEDERENGVHDEQPRPEPRQRRRQRAPAGDRTQVVRGASSSRRVSS
jgi:DNA-directed RNA polymerase specialized sigma24 family protein